MCTFSRQYVYIWVSWLLYLNRKAKRITIAQTQVYKLDKTKRIHPLLLRVQLFYRMYCVCMYKVVSVSHKTNTNTKRLINVSIKYTQLRENFIYIEEKTTLRYTLVVLDINNIFHAIFHSMLSKSLSCCFC